MSNWNNIKAEVEANIAKAGITNSEAKKAILTFERRRNTCLNMLYVSHRTWEAMTESSAYMQASDALDSLNNLGDFKPEEAKFWHEWVAYCNAAGFGATANLGDHLC